MKTDKKIYCEGKWRKCWISVKGYYRFRLNGKDVPLHRYFYQAYYRCSILPGIDVHHIDGDKLNNHPHNLELMTHAQHNREHKFGNKHRFKGGSVYWLKSRNRWIADIQINKKTKRIGSFLTKQEAREACNEYFIGKQRALQE